MDSVLDNLNNAQIQAVTTTEGFVRVIAGAGSGKTRALTHRFAYLVNELGILPANILCVTFTNKAANEILQRIHNLTGDNDSGRISTFHSFCVTVLQEDSFALQYPKSFLVLDNSDIDDMGAARKFVSVKAATGLQNEKICASIRIQRRGQPPSRNPKAKEQT